MPDPFTEITWDDLEAGRDAVKTRIQDLFDEKGYKLVEDDDRFWNTHESLRSFMQKMEAAKETHWFPLTSCWRNGWRFEDRPRNWGGCGRNALASSRRTGAVRLSRCAAATLRKRSLSDG